MVTSHLHFDVIHLHGFSSVSWNASLPGMLPSFQHQRLLQNATNSLHSRQRVGCDLVPITEPHAYHIVRIVVIFAYLRLQLLVVLPKGPYLQ